MTALAFCALVAATASDASAETRSLKLYNTHTKERAEITFKRNGRYVQSGLKQLNHFLRDWRRNEPTNMDPELFDLVWEVYRKARTNEYIHVVSAYRSLKTNNMLRSRSRGVAKNSQHTKGHAMDFFIPGVSPAKLRALGLRQHVGGVGYYPRSNTPFVHMDTGSVRHWPRMSRRELAKVFPDGKTIHVPSDGKPMKGYQVALAEIKRRDSGGSRTAVASSRSSSSERSSGGGNFFARLFTDNDEDEGATPSTRSNNPTRAVASARPDPVTAVPAPKTVVAAAPAVAEAPAPAKPEPTAEEFALASALPHAKPETEIPAEATTGLAEAAPITIQPRGKPIQAIQVASAEPQVAVPLPRTPRDAVDAIAALAGDTPASKPNNIQLAAYAPTNDAAPNGALPKSSLNALLPPASTAPQTTASVSGHMKDPLAKFIDRPAPSKAVMLGQDETARNWQLAYLYHPNQMHLDGLIAPVNSIVANDFAKRPAAQVNAQFAGQAVKFLKRASAN
ncbi:DUF882 domain-containing protein [Pseudovibrio exalbescens]|uniref:DUF882 domain-containing protein n=1 Tax=Pseudovibrio exalbescens TaxID=197461 RepID=UPI00236590CC|nr:DUF882 domain-containing protein [Pseudovibrio exalbescens]MDD7911859.1 DUF882 domain-containing protein [Pseudovibrio exalbescens]